MAVRQYQSRPVPDAVVERIAEAGRLTGSCTDWGPWHRAGLKAALIALNQFPSSPPWQPQPCRLPVTRHPSCPSGRPATAACLRPAGRASHSSCALEVVPAARGGTGGVLGGSGGCVCEKGFCISYRPPSL
jgi:hypothetical protein